MLQRFWILLIKILVLEFHVFKANAVNSEDFLLPPSGVILNPIDTSNLRLVWNSPNITNETLTGFNITWSGNGATFVGNWSTEFNINNLPIPGRNYTASISAYYATQQNSEYINATSNTYPAPATSITVLSRQINQFYLNWTTSGDSTDCLVWVEQATNATTLCFSGNRTAVITNLHTPGMLYTIHIVVQSGQLNSTGSSINDITLPSAPYNLTVTSRGTNWLSLSFDKEGHWDKCTAWADNAVGSNGSCSAESKSATIINLPTAGIEYTIHIVGTSGTFNSSNATTVQRASPPTPGPLHCISEANASLTIGIERPNGSFELDGYIFSISSTIPAFLYSFNRTEIASTAQPNITFTVTNLTAGVRHSISATTTIKSLLSSDQSHTECTTDLNAPYGVGTNYRSEMAAEIVWNSPQGNFDGFNASCDGQNQAKDAFSVRYGNPKPTTSHFSTVCSGLTAGALYSVIVSTFLNESTLTPMKPSDSAWFVTVPQPPRHVSAYPIDTSSIQMQLLYGYDASESQCTVHEILYSNWTDVIDCAAVNHSLYSLQSDSLYNISTYALSNYSYGGAATSKPISSLAWTLAPPVTSITGNESSPWSLDVIIDHHPFPVNVWQYAILVTNSEHLVQSVQITCSDVNTTTLTTVNCDRNITALSMLNSSTTCFTGFNYNITNLKPYTTYNISVHAVNPGGCSDSKSISLRTNESAPGAVQFFAASSLSDNNQCNASKLTWKEPAANESNGIITNYVIRWQQVNGADNGIRNVTVPGDWRQAIVSVKPDNQQYNFMIRAKTSAGEGVEKTSALPSTGSCYPTQTQNVSSILVKVDSNDATSTTNSFIVHYDPTFFQHNDNGDITHSGLFVREVADNENVKVMTETGPQSLYSNAMTWSTAIKSPKIPEYLATTDNWLSAAARKKRSASSQYTIGGTSTCSKTTNQSCNGPLPSNRAYKVRAIICTGSGCYKTEDTDYVYRTKKPSSLGWIAAVVIIPIVCIVLVVLIVLVIRRRRKKNKKGKNDESELPPIGNGGRNHQRFRITSKPIPIDSFIQIADQMHRDSDLLFSDEYKEIQEASPKYPWSEAEGESVKAKNRFINILPFDRTRVHLEEFRTGSDYINANYVMSGSDHREYIAAQGPLHTTVDDFWQMVWQERSTVIVMLTNLKESGRVKCEQYWPKTLHDATPCGQVSVTMTQEQAYASYVIRHFTARAKGESRNLTQFHFVAWPDFGVPADSQVLMDFIRVVRQSIGHQIEPPTIVHCSAGVGRTGTFIALDRLLRQVNDAVSIDVFGTVLQLREFRCQMVQTEAQYIFIHDCMSLEIDRLRNSGSPYEGVYNDAYDDTAEPLYANGNQVTQELNKRNTGISA